MNNYAVKIVPDQGASVIEAPDGLPLNWFYRQIDCSTIETVRPDGLPDGLLMVIDEMGKIKDRPINIVPSVWYGYFRHGDPIVGPVLVVREELTAEGLDLAGLNKELADEIALAVNGWNSDEEEDD